jgi:hypothetical protein
MRFSEFIKGGSQPIRSTDIGTMIDLLKQRNGKNESPASELGAHKFGTDIFNIQKRTPHWEMQKIIEILETRPHVLAAVEQIVRFVIGDEIIVESSDEKSKEIVEKWIDSVPRCRTKIFNLALLGIAAGNSYLEPLYKRTLAKNGKVFSDFDIVPDPSRVYKNINPSMKVDLDYWVYEIPMSIRSTESQKAMMYKVNYIRGGILFEKAVWGLGYPKGHFSHLKMGWSRDGLYGRGFLASAIDDNDVIKEIIKNIAMIARYRALNTKFITPASDDVELIEDDIEAIEQRLLNKRDEEHVVFNNNLKIESLANTNEYDTMSGELDFLRKDVNSGLVPNYVTPWDNDTNRATAGETKIPFSLKLTSYKEDIVEFLEHAIVDRIRQDNPTLAPNTKITFNDINMESYDTRVNIGQALYSSGVISFNEMRKMAGLQPVPGGDKFAWEIQTQLGDTILEQLPERISQKR